MFPDDRTGEGAQLQAAVERARRELWRPWVTSAVCRVGVQQLEPPQLLQLAVFASEHLADQPVGLLGVTRPPFNDRGVQQHVAMGPGGPSAGAGEVFARQVVLADAVYQVSGVGKELDAAGLLVPAVPMSLDFDDGAQGRVMVAGI